MGYDSYIVSVPGANKGDIFIYTLSTCIWCQKTKKLLAELGVSYSYIDIDMVSGDAQEEVMAEFAKKNPETSFPTIVLEGNRVLQGFQEAELRDFVGAK